MKPIYWLALIVALVWFCCFMRVPAGWPEEDPTSEYNMFHNSVVQAEVNEKGHTLAGAEELANYTVVILKREASCLLPGWMNDIMVERFKDYYKDPQRIGEFYQLIFKIHDWAGPVNVDVDHGVIVVPCDDGTFVVPIIPGERRPC